MLEPPPVARGGGWRGHISSSHSVHSENQQVQQGRLGAGSHSFLTLVRAQQSKPVLPSSPGWETQGRLWGRVWKWKDSDWKTELGLHIHAAEPNMCLWRGQLMLIDKIVSCCVKPYCI